MSEPVKVKFNLRLKEVLAEVRKNFGYQVDGWGEDAVTIARQMAPRDTGEMEGTIECKGEEGKTSRRAVLHADNPAAHQEFGTAHNRAQPFMLPAVIIAKQNTKERIRQEGLV